MTSRMRIYYTCLVGALAGLVCWGIVVILTNYGLFPGIGDYQDFLNMTLLGGAIGGLVVGFSDYWAEGSVLPGWVASGVVVGLFVGLLGAFFMVGIAPLLPDGMGIWRRVLPWALAGELIGFGVGMRWFAINRHTPLLATLGGMIGAALGGLIFTAFSSSGSSGFVQATAFVLTGVGITTGITLAPQLFSMGVIQFVSSTDPKAYSKARGHEWSLQEGDKLLIGSLSGQNTNTMMRREVELFLSDSLVAARHAYIFAQNGSFFIQNHDDNVAEGGMPHQPLSIWDQPVVGIQRLKDGDMITVGMTMLRFHTKKRRH
jgi:hypothetical protein